jgi:hypothetical protein
MATHRPNSASLYGILALLLGVATSPTTGQSTTSSPPPDTLPTVFSIAPGSSSRIPVTTRPDSIRPRFGTAILGGTLGSAAGLAAGAAIGFSMATCDSGEWFCGVGEMALGGLIGSTVGSTLGANLGARHPGHEPTFGSTFQASLLGGLFGIFGAYMGVRVDPDGAGGLVGFSLAQGVVTGLLAAHGR